MSKFHFSVIDEGPWRYRLDRNYRFATNILGHTCQGVRDYLELNGDGVLVIRKNYTWNGPSGPTIDTADSIRASCVHDAGYQLLRQGDLPRKPYRKRFDQMLRDIAVEDHMPKWRAWYWYWGVRIGARRSSYPGGGSMEGM